QWRGNQARHRGGFSCARDRDAVPATRYPHGVGSRLGRRRLSCRPVMLQLTSAFGLVAIVGLAWLMSEKKRLFPWRTVLWGILLQFAIALFVLHTNAGLVFFDACQR